MSDTTVPKAATLGCPRCGGSLFCLRCLRPFIAAGERFQPSISVRRTA